MQKRSLTKHKICEAAIEVIEADGLEGLSMRRLASKLNIEAASLYNHITGKAQLFDCIQEHLYSQIPANFFNSNWKTHLFELAMSTRRKLLQCPQVVILFATRPTITTSSLNQADFTLNILINAGFKPSEGLSIFRNLHVFVLGHVLAEVGRVSGEKDSSTEPSLRLIDIDEYPTLKKISSYKASVDFEKGFKMGLECMLNGLETLLKKATK